MPRKVVKVYIPKEMKVMLEVACIKLGLPESEVMRLAFFELASKHSLVTESFHK
jgi:hypothetical protein